MAEPFDFITQTGFAGSKFANQRGVVRLLQYQLVDFVYKAFKVGNRNMMIGRIAGVARGINPQFKRPTDGGTSIG